MWKRNAVPGAIRVGAVRARCGGMLAVALLGLISLASKAAGQAQGRDLPPGPMQEKARKACLPCHTAQIIVQQQLDRRVWTKEMDKMIRWGAPVAAEDRDALIDYFTQNFGPHDASPSEAALPPGPGADKVGRACLGCHDTSIISQQQLDRSAWTRVLDKMIRWGAPVRPADREAILHYLATHFFPSAKSANKEN